MNYKEFESVLKWLNKEGVDINLNEDEIKQEYSFFIIENKAINFTDSSLQLNGVNKISFKEFIREFCVRTETDLWLYKGVTYNDREIDIVYKNYCKKQGF